MSRSRALLAVLLAVAWCSAAWHANLEAVGLLLDHEHTAAAAHGHGDHHAPTSIDDEHDSLVARINAKDIQVRDGSGTRWIALLAGTAWLGLGRLHRLAEIAAAPRRGRHDPPLARVWHFVWRCALKPAAPPALA